MKNKSGWWLLQVVAAFALLAPGGLHARQECSAVDAHGIQRCKAGLDEAQVRHIRVTQEKSQWCWAASIAMVFAHHGFMLPQERIVRQHFGDARDRAVPGVAITQMLGNSWQDGQGGAFAASVRVGDSHGRSFQFGTDTVIHELAEQRPMIVGVLEHAMVLVQVEYERFPAQDAVRITGATVIDPAQGKGVRRLELKELRPSYVAAVRTAAQEVSSLSDISNY